MKKNLILFLLLSSNCLFAQNWLRVTYEATMTLDESKSTNEKKIQRTFIPTTYELTINNQLSQFHYVEKINNYQGDAIVSMVNQKEDIFIDLNLQSIFYKEEIANNMYLISKKTDDLEWKIDRQTHKMFGYNVKKANLIWIEDGIEDKIEAFFTPDIPLKHGPKGLGNLPGLILSLNIYTEMDTAEVLGIHYKMTNIEILEKEPKITLPKGKNISYEESIKLWNELFKKLDENRSQGIEK